jgi:tetratricopeptide (TPR) repeat protein
MLARHAPPDVIAALVDGHAALATILLQQGDAPRAIALASGALAAAQRAAAEQPRETRLPFSVAHASFMLATMLPPSEALPVWTDTFDRYEKLLAANPDRADLQRNVALTCKYMGTLLENAGELDRARTLYARAVDLDEQRLRAAPADTRVQFDAAISFASLANAAHKQGDLDAASRMFERSLLLRRALSDADPQNMQARHRLGYVLAQLAFANRKRQPHRARQYAREAIEVLQPVLATTGDVRARFDLGFASLQGALAAENTGNRVAACSGFRDAQRFFSRDIPKQVGDSAVFAAQASQGVERCRARGPGLGSVR